MTGRFIIYPKADRDIDSHADYLAVKASAEVAARFLEAASRTFALLATQPQMGWRSRVRLRELKQLRVFRVEGFAERLIIYRPIESGVAILRVVPGTSNLRSLLRRDGIS